MGRKSFLSISVTVYPVRLVLSCRLASVKVWVVPEVPTRTSNFVAPMCPLRSLQCENPVR